MVVCVLFAHLAHTVCSGSFLYVHVEVILLPAFMMLKPYQLSLFTLFLLTARHIPEAGLFHLSFLLQGMLPPTLGQASFLSFISQLKMSPPLRSLSIPLLKSILPTPLFEVA